MTADDDGEAGPATTHLSHGGTDTARSPLLPDPSAAPRSAVSRWLRRGASVLLLVAVVDYFVLPQIAGARAAMRLLDTVRPWWAVVAVVLEAASLVSYSLLTRSMLPGRRPRFSWVMRGDVAALGLSHVLPGGTATSSALRYRLLHLGGTRAEDAAVGIAVQGVGSTLTLAVLLWLALIMSIPVLGLHRAYVTAALVGAILIAGALLALLLHSRQPAPTTAPFAALIRLPPKVRPRVQHAAIVASEQLRELLADRRALGSSALWAAGNWALDAASLWVFLIAYGHRINPVALFVAYGIANLLGTLPISPGGLGVIEGVLIPSLVAFGTPPAVAVLAVVSWRLFEFWAPIPLGGLCYLSIRAQQWRASRGQRNRQTAVKPSST